MFVTSQSFRDASISESLIPIAQESGTMRWNLISAIFTHYPHTPEERKGKKKTNLSASAYMGNKKRTITHKHGSSISRSKINDKQLESCRCNIMDILTGYSEIFSPPKKSIKSDREKCDHP